MNLVLSLTERCNLRCTYCYYKVSHEARSLVMSDDVSDFDDSEEVTRLDYTYLGSEDVDGVNQ